MKNTQISSEEVLDAPIPAIGGVNAGVTLMKSGESGFTVIVKGVREITKAQAKKLIRFGVGGHEDVLNKGFHIHIGKLELGLRPD